MKIVRVLALASIAVVPLVAHSQAVPSDIRESIMARCRSQMGSLGASMVKFCVDEDVAAYVALTTYETEWRSVIDRCRNQMLSTGGWDLVKFCADEDIAAERDLRGEVVAQVEPEFDGISELVPGCVNPPLVMVPDDGANATEEELLAVQSNIQAYMAAMEEYIGCIDEDLEEGGGEDSPAVFQAVMVQRHNQGVEEMEEIANAFNEQVQAYRCRGNPSAEECEANPQPEREGEDQ